MITNKRTSNQTKRKAPFVTYYYPESALADQFQMIQTNINFLMSEKTTQTLMVTSPEEGDGKSTMLANLAVSMAQQKKKVLLIDTNLRTPALHDFFHTSNSTGLTDLLTGRMNFGEVVHHTEIWRLDLLASGPIPKNPVELLGSKMMKDLLVKLKESYDVIILDSSALLKLPDTKLLAGLCDGVLLVIKSGKTKLQNVTEAKKVLEFAKARLIGAILNQ
ncbi:CpsD/CapB family tyrosine-protein kinase [Neobacillus sp. OS1-33]|uniref:CpsD/CapB family tyrosine-protein kinase n=1 Tax=Neobacillus sp. OS1-33 TaxID=3070683 RepID=UPI0027E07B79|nr:CpsD/CapB family tyrosine-protein kinase [Neobacillus sp. OS1-33]WML25137.1 CpsD/CapB family tyrosine-protein kinase [Neobacillus sp. OS1-33]